MHSSKDRVSVGLLWHSLRVGNLGTGALTLSQLSMLKTAAHAAKRPLSVRILETKGPLWYPPEDMPVEETFIEWFTDILPDAPLWGAVADCDVILDIGTGDLFSDIYGESCFFGVFCSKIAVLAQRKPLILSPQTIGPFKNPYIQSLAGQLVRRCERTFTRDHQSFSLLREMGIAEGVEEAIDIAFRLPFNPPPRLPGQAIRFGLNVSGLLYDDAATKQFSFGTRVDYPSLINRIITMLIQQPGISVVLVPHVIGEGARKQEDDVWICRKLAAEFKLEMAPRFKSPIEAKSFISGLDILAGSRMHATVAALSSGVPVVPLAYSRKFSGIFGSVSYPLVCDLLTQDEESVLACVLDAVRRLPDLRAAAARSNAIAQSKLDVYQTYLNRMMLTLP